MNDRIAWNHHGSNPLKEAEHLHPRGLGEVRCCRLLLAFLAATTLVAQSSTTADRRKFWDDLFRNGQISFNRKPSKLLQDAVSDRQPGAAIDLGMGEGRNAVFLASKGWQVTGVDFSPEVVKQAKAISWRPFSGQIGLSVDRLALRQNSDKHLMAMMQRLGISRETVEVRARQLHGPFVTTPNAYPMASSLNREISALAIPAWPRATSCKNEFQPNGPRC